MATITLKHVHQKKAASEPTEQVRHEQIAETRPAWPKKPKGKRKQNMAGGGKRVKEVKRVNERIVDPEKRIARLVAIAHEFGPEKLENEISLHERTLSNLKAALATYFNEVNK